MNKTEFLDKLKAGLTGLPEGEAEDRIAFYSEMISDRMDEDKTEEEAVQDIGTVDEVISQILADVPISVLVKEKVKTKRPDGVISSILLIAGSPVWASLIVALLAVIMAVYVSVWAIIVSLWACLAALAACALAGTVLFFMQLRRGHILPAVAALGAGLFCGGAAVLWFSACRKLTAALLHLTKLAALRIKKAMLGRRG